MASVLSQLSQRTYTVQLSWFCVLALSMVTFTTPLDIALGDSRFPSPVDLSFQVQFKLLSCGLASFIGFWGFLSSATIRRTFLSFPAVLLLTLAGFFCLSAVLGISRSAIPATGIFIGVLFFVATCYQVMSFTRIMQSILLGLFAYIAVCWLLVWFAPDYGIYAEHLDNQVVTTRMGGAAHPNTLGRITALALLLTSFLYRQSQLSLRAWLILTAISGWTLLETKSRTALGAGILALGFIWFDLWRTRLGVYGALTLALLSSGGIIGLFLTGQEDRVLGKLIGATTKTGDVEEVTSVTGRTEIWTEALKYIERSPWWGYGIGSAPLLLVDHLQNTHNILLNPTLTSGLFAGTIVLMLLLWMLLVVVLSRHGLLRAVFLYILISGVVEDTILEVFPSPTTLLWLCLCVYASLRNGQADGPENSAALARSPTASATNG